MTSAPITITRFPLGLKVATPGASDHLTPWEMAACLNRHGLGDWGEVDDEDKATNDAAMVSGGRLLSAYTVRGVQVWVITEADRRTTTLLLPDEY
ncbi:MAG: hypothetical protein FJ125_08300 [Deltaproteobacteria bacterium]|nr:hypothetical protein [Deltaproteobacteria bacterium]